MLGRQGANLIFVRTDGDAWGKSRQFRPLRDGCAAARIEPAISFHILRHTYASRLALAGTPMPVIAAQLRHEGTRMTERHYAHLTPNYVADGVQASFSRLGIVPTSNVAASALLMAALDRCLARRNGLASSVGKEHRVERVPPGGQNQAAVLTVCRAC